MQIKVYYNHKNKVVFGLSTDKKSKQESFLTRDTNDPSILQVSTKLVIIII